MTRAEATARVVAAAKRVAEPERYGTNRWVAEGELCYALCALDACPPEDTVDVLGIHVPRDLYDARALACAAGWQAYEWREWGQHTEPQAWNCPLARADGWWPTRDAEHAAGSGRYRVDTERGGDATANGGRSATASSVTPAPSGPEVVAGGEVAALAARLDALLERFDALHDHSFANARRLDALAAQVGRVERAVRAVCQLPLAMTRYELQQQALAILDGGPDAPA